MSLPLQIPSTPSPLSKASAGLALGTSRIGLTLALLAGVAPGEAAASQAMIAGDAPIADEEQRQRVKPGPLSKGPYGEVAWRPALGLFGGGVVPEMRLSTSLGARLSTRFKLAVRPHVDILLDRPKASGVGIDMLATVYTWRRLFVRAGLGVVSAAPYMYQDMTSRPGYGGFVGLGYDWHLKKKVNMGVGADLDVRWLKDGTPRMTLISGVHFWFG